MGVSDRWVRKLLKRMKQQGDGVVVHGLRGRASNRKIRRRRPSHGAGPSEAAGLARFRAYLRERTVSQAAWLEVSDETLRGWMIEAGLWKTRRRAKSEDVHCWRPRRSGFGELVQWDTSEHDWLEGRGPVRYLVRHDRRRHQLELGTLCGARCDAAQHGGAVGVSGEKRADGGCVHGSRLDVHHSAARPEKAERSDSACGTADADRARPARTGDRLDRSLLAASQGAHRTQLFNGPGSPGEATAAGPDFHHGGGQRVSGKRILAGMECALRAAGGRLPQSPSAA